MRIQYFLRLEVELLEEKPFWFEVFRSVWNKKKKKKLISIRSHTPADNNSKLSDSIIT